MTCFLGQILNPRMTCFLGRREYEISGLFILPSNRTFSNIKINQSCVTAELGGCHMKLLAQILIGCYCNASPLYLLVCLALCFSFLFSNSHLQLFQ